MHWLMSIFYIRHLVSQIITISFGYVAPILATSKAIVTEDIDGIRESLTYWCVMTIMLCVEAALFFGNARIDFPESKALLILWLTLPRFQGSFRIYKFILQPYFEKYESEIDTRISNISKKVHKTATRQFQLVLWQIFLAPNDGLLAASPFSSALSTAVSYIAKSDRMKILRNHLNYPDTESMNVSTFRTRKARPFLTRRVRIGLKADNCADFECSLSPAETFMIFQVVENGKVSLSDCAPEHKLSLLDLLEIVFDNNDNDNYNNNNNDNRNRNEMLRLDWEKPMNAQSSGVTQLHAALQGAGRDISINSACENQPTQNNNSAILSIFLSPMSDIDCDEFAEQVQLASHKARLVFIKSLQRLSSSVSRRGRHSTLKTAFESWAASLLPNAPQ